MRALEKRNLGRTGYQATFCGFGTVEIGRDAGLGQGDQIKRPSAQKAGQMLNAVLDVGINLIDTARAYHASEERIGEFIAARRHEYFLASKCGEHSDEPRTYYDFSYRAVKDSIDQTLERLNTDRVDLMQIHFGPDPRKVLEDGETLRAMKEARDEGKVRFLGASTAGEVARRCIESGEFDVMQLDYSLLDHRDEELVDLCGRQGIGVLIRGGLGYGALTPRVVNNLELLTTDVRRKVEALLELVDGDPERLIALALRFIYRNQNVTSVLIGTRNAAHLKQNLELLDGELDDSLLERAVRLKMT